MTERYLSSSAKFHICEALSYIFGDMPENLEEYAIKLRIDSGILKKYLEMSGDLDRDRIDEIPDNDFPNYIELRELVQLEGFELMKNGYVKAGLEALQQEQDFIAEKAVAAKKK